MDQTWYQEFVSNSDGDMLIDLVSAAHSMEIKELLDLTVLRITFMLTETPAEQLNNIILRLMELFKKEEAQARQDHQWIFED